MTCIPANDEIPRLGREFADRGPVRACPGYGDGNCGGQLMEGSDLCGDCYSTRLDVESPRIPR